MFLRFFTKLIRIFGLVGQLLLITSLLVLYVQPFQVMSTDVGGTSNSNQGTNNQSVLGSILPACSSASQGINLFLECAKQVTLAILIVGIIFVFVRIAYESAASLISGGTSAASIKQIRDLLGSLIVGIVLVGMPALIIQSIDPLGGRIVFNFLQELNFGPDAQLISIDKEPDVATCSGLKLCVDGCVKAIKNTSNLQSCVEVCKQRNRSSEDSCSEACIEKIGPNGEMSEFVRECVHKVLTEPPQTNSGSSGNPNSGSGNNNSGGSGNSGNNQGIQLNPNAKDVCKAFDACLANANSGYLKNYQPDPGCGSCYQGIGRCIQDHRNTCDCANNDAYFDNPPEGFSGKRIKLEQAGAFKQCMEGR